jgi:YVTN family beta-propeller protein
VIDCASDSVLATVAVGSEPYALCYNPTNNKVYCANPGSNSVTVIDGATNAVLATVTVGAGCCALYHNSQNNKVYCANSFIDSVTVINGTTDVAVATIGVGVGPIDLAWSPIQNRIYVADYGSHSISVLRDSGGGVEEDTKPQVADRKLDPTVLSGASGVMHLAASVVFDAMGRRVVNPRSGIYFLGEGLGARGQGLGRMRKVVLQR